MPRLDYPVSNIRAFSTCDLSAGPTPQSEVTTALTQRYLQVDAGLVASHVRRLKFLNENDNDTDEEYEVHLRSKGEAEGSDSGQRLSMPCLCSGCGSPNSLPGPIRSRPHLDSSPKMAT